MHRLPLHYCSTVLAYSINSRFAYRLTPALKFSFSPLLSALMYMLLLPARTVPRRFFKLSVSLSEAMDAVWEDFKAQIGMV